MKRSLVLLILAAIMMAGCTTSGATGVIEVTDVWGRNSPMAAQNGAFYMVISNNSGQDDTLIGAQADICGTVELHEMYKKENDVMGMRQVPGGEIELPSGDTVELKVGGLHVMCIGKKAPFEVGDKFPITLQFANAGDMEVTAEIRESQMEMDG
ncbi:MAG: copper chaperone PCu(A)C [Candidatus Promineifilaceae bacterium]|nr:copper chaperone PCu(A)C [Candidatus Promineifilaceae bacterium]